MEIKSPYIAKQVKAQLNNSKIKVLESDQDRLFIFTGPEGSGKSTLAMQFAYHLDKSFCLDNIVFDADTFAKRIREVKKHSAIIFDEAFNGLSSKSALSHENKKLVRLLMECRQRNLFIFIVLPSIFLLEKYVALYRSHVLFHTAISKKNFKSRFYKCYNRYNKQLLYLLGKKMLSYSRPNIIKKYRFYAKLPPSIDKDKYDEKKLDAFKIGEKKDSERSKRFKLQRDVLITFIHKKKKVKFKEIEKLFDKYEVSLNHKSMSHIALNTPKIRIN